MEEQLTQQPLTQTKHRKPLPTLLPSFEHVAPIWQLSVGSYRVFYDVDQPARVVFIRAVRLKLAHTTTEDIV